MCLPWATLDAEPERQTPNANRATCAEAVFIAKIKDMPDSAGIA